MVCLICGTQDVATESKDFSDLGDGSGCKMPGM